MNKLKEIIQVVRTFFADVVGEMRKSVWPDRQELMSSTTVVIVALLMLAAFVGVFDRVLHVVLRLLVYRG